MFDEKAAALLERSPFHKTLAHPARYNNDGRMARAQKTRQQLIDAALSYMRSNEGRMPVSVLQIVRLSGVSKGSMYNHFQRSVKSRVEDFLAEALQDDDTAAEIGALIAKRKGIKGPTSETNPNVRLSDTLRWWRTVLIALARPT